MDFDKIGLFIAAVLLIVGVSTCSSKQSACEKKGGALVKGVWGYECIQRVK